jgi:hypothetical protein
VHQTALTQSVLDRAEKMGTQGFHNGETLATSVALHNLTFVEHSGLGARDVMALMDAYNRGWHREHHAAADDALREINFPLPRLYKNSRRRSSRRVRPNAYFERFKILDASIDRQDHVGRDVYRIDVEITAPRRQPSVFGGRYAPAQTVPGDTMVIRVYPDGRFNMLDSRGMTEYRPYDLAEAQRKKVLAAVKKLGGKVPDIYAPRR